MARRLKELRQFEKGMYGQADGTDIPKDAAAICINTEPEAPYGTIRGIAKDSTVFASLSNYNDFDVMKVLKDRSGTNDLIGVDFSNNEVGVIADYDEATRSYTSKSSISHSSVASIETVNNQAFIGLGNTSTTVPQWVGKVNKGQFGDTPPSGYQIEDAALTPPKVIEIEVSAAIDIKVDDGFGGLELRSTIVLPDTSELPDSGMLLVNVDLGASYDNDNNYIGIVFTGNDTSTNTLTILWPSDIEDTIDFMPGALQPNGKIGNPGSVFYYMEVGPGVVDDNEMQMIGIYNPTKNIVRDSALRYDNNASVPSNINGDNFEENNFWGIGVSYIYDGYKESPIKRIPLGEYWFGYGNSIDSWEELTFKFFIQGFTNSISTASSRITAIKFYINVTGSENDGVGTNQINSFRLLEELNITDSINAVKTLSHLGLNVGYQYNITAGAYEGNLYTDESGLNEYQSSSTVNYFSSCQHNSQLFAANVYNPSAADENWTNYIVRSVEFSYDVFNWVDNYLVMPNPITAIASYGGRVFAFDEYNMYRVNPDQLYIEDTFNGLGCKSKQSLIDTEYGLFVANNTGVYLYDGRNVNHISKPVDFIDAVEGFVSFGYKESVKNYGSSFKPLLSFDSDKMCLLVFGNYNVSTRRIWMYCLPNQSWFVQGEVYDDIVDGNIDSVSDIKSIAMSASNSVLAAYSDGLYELNRSSNLKIYNWVSKKLSMDQVSQTKKFRKIYVSGNNVGNGDIEYSIDDASFANISSLDSSSSSSNGKKIQVRAKSTSSNTDVEIDDISIVYRDRSFPK